jgi:hypothetical protein
VDRTSTINRCALVGAIAVSLVAGSGLAAQAAEPGAPTVATSSAAPLTDADAATQAELEQGLQFIDSIPDSVLQGGEAAYEDWVARQRPYLQSNSFLDKVQCGAAITAAVASLAIPAAKVLRLKAFIAKAGSVKEAAYLLIRVSTGAEKLEALGPVLGSLAAEVLGITAIKKYCS